MKKVTPEDTARIMALTNKLCQSPQFEAAFHEMAEAVIIATCRVQAQLPDEPDCGILFTAVARLLTLATAGELSRLLVESGQLDPSQIKGMIVETAQEMIRTVHTVAVAKGVKFAHFGHGVDPTNN